MKRSVKEEGYRRFISERFGFFRSKRPGEVVWIHSVSAGETIAAAPLVRRLLDAGYPCLVTNMTPSGRDRVRVLHGDRVENCYAPYDTPGAVRRFLDNNHPLALVTIDTELWPNIIAGCARRGIPTSLINGRMAKRSARRYALFPLTAPMLRSMELIAVQREPHAERFKELGADGNKVLVTGGIKFDGDYAPGHDLRLEKARNLVLGREVLLGASTHSGEEQALLNCLPVLQEISPNFLLILAPRHTHRVDQLQKQCQSSGYKPRLYSSATKLESADRVLILDVMGQLESYFHVAKVAFIGGSLIPVGGHNLLEAVRAGAGVIMGPHLDNIEDIAVQFIESEAMRVIGNREELAQVIIDLMQDEVERVRMVNAALSVLNENRGSIKRNFELILRMLEFGR